MAKTLMDAVRAVQAVARAIPGVASAYDFPPGVAPSGVFSVATVRNADCTLISSGLRRVKGTIVCAILTPFKDLARDTETMLPLLESLLDGFETDPTLGGTVDTITGTGGVRGSLGEWPYAGQPYFGWRVEIDVKIQG